MVVLNDVAPWFFYDVWKYLKTLFFDLSDFIKALWNFLYEPRFNGYSFIDVILGAGSSILIAWLTIKVVKVVLDIIV